MHPELNDSPNDVLSLTRTYLREGNEGLNELTSDQQNSTYNRIAQFYTPEKAYEWHIHDSRTRFRQSVGRLMAHFALSKVWNENGVRDADDARRMAKSFLVAPLGRAKAREAYEELLDKVQFEIIVDICLVREEALALLQAPETGA